MAVVIAAMSIILAVCGVSTAHYGVSAGTLLGRVTAGPTCPVERVGHPCPPAPVSATVKAKTRNGWVVSSTQRTPTGVTGFDFRSVPTGLFGPADPFPLPTGQGDGERGLHDRAAISCDTGIR